MCPGRCPFACLVAVKVWPCPVCPSSAAQAENLQSGECQRQGYAGKLQPARLQGVEMVVAVRYGREGDYSCDGQVQHSSPEDFIADIRKVWNNVAEVCESDVTLIVRFGGIAGRKENPLDLAKDSFKESPWRLLTICNAESANKGRRQADMFLQKKSEPVLEYDLWARFV